MIRDHKICKMRSNRVDRVHRIPSQSDRHFGLCGREALAKPKCITLHSYKPLIHVKAILSLSSSFGGICQ